MPEFDSPNLKTVIVTEPLSEVLLALPCDIYPSDPLFHISHLCAATKLTLSWFGFLFSHLMPTTPALDTALTVLHQFQLPTSTALVPTAPVPTPFASCALTASNVFYISASHFLSGLAMWSLLPLLPFYCFVLMI
jgi:hypothetical protein